MRDAGWDSTVGRADQRQNDFNRLVDIIYRKYGVQHPYWDNHVVIKPDTIMSADIRFIDGQRHDEPCLVSGYWIPEWIARLLQYERKWKLECNKQTATASDHDDIVDALHAGLSGDVEQLDSFLCGKELAHEYNEEHGLTDSGPALNFENDPNTGLYMSGSQQISLCVGGYSVQTFWEKK